MLLNLSSVSLIMDTFGQEMRSIAIWKTKSTYIPCRKVEKPSLSIDSRRDDISLQDYQEVLANRKPNKSKDDWNSNDIGTIGTISKRIGIKTMCGFYSSISI